jgi:hypothetical protein
LSGENLQLAHSSSKAGKSNLGTDHIHSNPSHQFDPRFVQPPVFKHPSKDARTLLFFRQFPRCAALAALDFGSTLEGSAAANVAKTKARFFKSILTSAFPSCLQGG